jgi:hypothetical protein
MERQCEKEIQLWKKVPLDIFINHIIPYTYKKINNQLLNDIRNFTFDFQMIINYYYLDMNETCLLVDLTFFCNSNCNILYVAINHSFTDILDRNFTFKNFSLDKKMDFIKKNFYFNINVNTHKKNKFLLSLLTPSERTSFINEYIIQYYDE